MAVQKIDVTSPQGRREAVQKLRDLEAGEPANPKIQTLTERRTKLVRDLAEIDRELRDASLALAGEQARRDRDIASLRKALESSAGSALDALISSLETQVEFERLRPGPFVPSFADAVLKRVQELQRLILEARSAKSSAVDPEAAAAAIWAKLPAPARASAAS
jgi:hypothetical protein